MVKEMCWEGNVLGDKTNYCLRATGASNMFEAGVPQKVIRKRTGHRSLQGLRHYEHTTAQ